MKNYIMIQNKINEIIDKIKELEREDDRLIKYTNKRLSFYNRAYEMYLQMLRLAETVDKMVKDSQTIDEEIEQQDVLKKDGNTFITLEAEGETLVNVCGHEEPVAITKSYTVENSGNHIALQGEYDGKCRPVITGNTMVNLYNVKDLTYVSSDWIVEGNTLKLTSTGIIYNNIPNDNKSLFKPSTVYTFVIDVLKFNTDKILVINSHNGGNTKDIFTSTQGDSEKIMINKEGRYILSKTTVGTFDDCDLALRTYWTNHDESVGDELELTIMIFEGDLTQTPELIPTEYVEGLKSSFEDGLVTDENDPNYGKYKVEYKVTGENLVSQDNWEMGSGIGDSSTYGIPYKQYKKPSNSRCRSINPIKVKPNTTYSISSKSGSIAIITLDKDTLVLKDSGWLENSIQFTIPNNCEYIGLIWCKNGNPDFTLDEIDESINVHELTKEYTKTFYLNSPLLEGNTIEEVNGNATHVKRYEKVVLNGSENYGTDTVSVNGLNAYYTYAYKGSNISLLSWKCDKLPVYIKESSSITNDFLTCSGGGYIEIITAKTLSELKQWLQDNPVTVVYQLASPIYEPITNESILCDSYLNGHLDFDSAVPIEKVEFKATEIPLKYTPNGNVILQYDSDNGGLVKQTLTTVTNPLIIDNIGFNASNIVVTEAGADFKYFKGLESSCENNELVIKTSDGVNESELTVQLNSPLLKGDRIEVIDGKMYHYHKMGKIVLDGSEDWGMSSIISEKTQLFYYENIVNAKFPQTNNEIGGKIICDEFFYSETSYNNTSNIENAITFAYSSLGININKSKLSTPDVNGFKQWLQANPTTVVYELAEPWYEEIQMSLYIKGVGKYIELDSDNINLSNINIKY